VLKDFQEWMMGHPHLKMGCHFHVRLTPSPSPGNSHFHKHFQEQVTPSLAPKNWCHLHITRSRKSFPGEGDRITRS
jgi:hypothetical protein